MVRRADGSRVETKEFKTTKTLDLLRMLVLTDGRPLPVEHLVGHLWPDVDITHGKASLRTAASQLRKVLGNDLIERRGDTFVVTRIWSDVTAYHVLADDAAEARRGGRHAETVAIVRRAEALYGGDVEVAGGSSDWLYDTRDGLRETRARLLLDAAEAAATCGWMRDSLDFAREAQKMEPNEEAARAIMRAYAGVGETRKAIDAFEQLRHQLVEEYGVDPSPQTRALYLQIVTACASWPPEQWTVGQEEPITALVAEVQPMLAPGMTRGVVWLTGLQGSGRDSVAREAARRLGVALRSRQRVPIEGIAAVATGSTTTAADTELVLMPEVEHVPAWLPAQMQALAEREGAVLLVPVSVDPAFDDIGLEGDDHQVVAVPALDGINFSRVAAVTLQGAPSDTLVAELHESSHGLAGLAGRIAARWLQQGRVIWTPHGLDLCDPAEIEDYRSGGLRAALRMLSPAGMDLLAVAAVATRGLSSSHLQAVARVVTGNHERELDDELEELVDAGLLRDDLGPFQVRDERVRREVLDWVRPYQRSRIRALLSEIDPGYAVGTPAAREAMVNVPAPRGAVPERAVG